MNEQTPDDDTSQADVDRELRAALAGGLALPPNPRLDPASIRRNRRKRIRHRFVLCASLVLALGLGGVGGWQAKSARIAAAAPPMEDAIAAYRIFATDRSRPVEMDAARGEELQAWLSARLGRPMALPDLQPYGFALLGGRMLATPEGAAAMLMYQDAEGRRISFYVRPSTRFADARGSRRDDGLALRYWYRNGYGFAVVGRAGDPRTLAVQQAIPAAT
ncbi:anti-sigma factor [Luteimonas sp. 8-5]|uniref:anti-sigma factor family protein n=1 Tax=Luteimonas sp. 8-5 TaxID=3039387 RepID=UPI0024371272|nr:anti-sigma factor [Luteimonas sp. 8-5]MDG6349525.1 anti-sigma factor [Luteimonas sp. 8-5]